MAEFGYPGIIATGVPGDGRPRRAAAPGDQYSGLTHAGDAHARDGDRSRQAVDRLSKRVKCAIAQLMCINLGAVRIPMPDGGASASGEGLTGVVIDDGLA